MSEVTKIQWADHTWSPWIGCSKVHTGCKNCYAEADMAIRRKRAIWGQQGTRSVTSDAYWRKPLAWNRKAAESGVRRRVFPSLCDPFDEHPDVGYWREMMFELIDQTPELDWLMLTKRPQNIASMWIGPPRDNVWLMYSASDQQTLDEGTPFLLTYQDLVPVLGLSLEPLVGPIDLSGYMSGEYVGLPGDMVYECYNAGISWVIVGGESGRRARVCSQTWIHSIVNQCRVSHVPVFVKQLGSWMRLRDSHGGDPTEWPRDLRVRQFPTVERHNV